MDTLVRAMIHPASLQGFFIGREWRGRPYLISPFFDFMLAGGLAGIVLLLLYVVLPAGSPDFSLHKAQTIAVLGVLAYFINDPHFMVSYQILYRNYPDKLRRFKEHRELWLRYVIAGIVVPLLLVAYFFYGMWAMSSAMFALAIQVMLILVGWHYVKQAFGVFIMLSAMKKIYYTGWRRVLLLGNCYVVWACYTLNLFTGKFYTPAQDFWGFKGTFPHITLPAGLPDILMNAILLSEIAAALAIIWKSKETSFSAFIGYFSMYYLLFASTYHPLWLFMVPAFHSLQYLMFVYAYKRGETYARLQDPQTAPRQVKYRLGMFIVSAVALGLLFMAPFPGWIERWVDTDGLIFFPLSAAFLVGINIHHYFIDNVIWRKEHAEIGRYMFYKHT